MISIQWICSNEISWLQIILRSQHLLDTQGQKCILTIQVSTHTLLAWLVHSFVSKCTLWNCSVCSITMVFTWAWNYKVGCSPFFSKYLTHYISYRMKVIKLIPTTCAFRPTCLEHASHLKILHRKRSIIAKQDQEYNTKKILKLTKIAGLIIKQVFVHPCARHF